MTNKISRRVVKICLLVIATVLVLLTVFHERHYGDQHSYLTGDEPHYVMMTDSLVRDGDFNLKNDYELRRAGSYYGYDALFPHLSPKINQRGSQWYSIHTIGLPLIMAVPYKFFHMGGARFWLMLVQFCTVSLFYFIMKKYLPDARQRWLGVILLLSCALFWQNLGGVFPDLVTVTLWGLVMLLFGRKDVVSTCLILAALYLGLLVHSKDLLLTGPLVLAHFGSLLHRFGWRQWLQRYTLPLVVFGLGILWYIYFLHHHYGIFTPTQLYGNEGTAKQLFTANPFTNVLAILTDRNKGLLVYAPVLLVVGPYVVMAIKALRDKIKDLLSKRKFRQDDYLLGGLLVGLGCLLVTQIGFLDWSGSIAPNGRYMLPVIFFTLFLIAKYADLRNQLQLIFVGPLVLVSLFECWVSVFDFHGFMSPAIDSDWVKGFPPLRHLPSFDVASYSHDHLATPRGLEILALLVIINVGLHFAYRYRLTYKLRKIAG